jgi:hypothetical protein
MDRTGMDKSLEEEMKIPVINGHKRLEIILEDRVGCNFLASKSEPVAWVKRIGSFTRSLFRTTSTYEYIIF